MMNTLSNFSNQEFIDKSNWEALSLFEIDELIEKYPYFSFLHLLKARKNRIEGIEEDAATLKKTTLYFNNIPWLMYQYNQMPVFSKPIEVLDVTKQSEENIYPDLEILENGDIDVKDNQEVNQEDNHEEIQVENQENEQEDLTGLSTNDNLDLEIEPAVTEFNQEDKPIEFLFNEEENEADEENRLNNTDIETNESEIEESINPLETIDQPDSAILLEATTILETEVEVDKQELIIHHSLIENTKEDIVEDQQIPIEDVYIGDYFATQGIHLDEIEHPEAKKINLTTNSFSDWLKLMQKIEHTEEVEIAEEKVSHQLNDIHESAIPEMDIQTETMADIYLKQGLKSKAIQIFEKLSLINPSKSAYFTSRINKINTI